MPSNLYQEVSRAKISRKGRERSAHDQLMSISATLRHDEKKKEDLDRLILGTGTPAEEKKEKGFRSNS